MDKSISFENSLIQNPLRKSFIANALHRIFLKQPPVPYSRSLTFQSPWFSFLVLRGSRTVPTMNTWSVILLDTSRRIFSEGKELLDLISDFWFLALGAMIYPPPSRLFISRLGGKGYLVTLVFCVLFRLSLWFVNPSFFRRYYSSTSQVPI